MDSRPGDIQRAPSQIVSDGRCPDLTGLYSETGLSIRDGTKTADAHLSWLIGGEKARTAKAPLNTPPGPGRPSVFYVKTMRITQPSPGHFELEALDSSGMSVGAFSFGPEDGWQCGENAFFVYRKDEGGGEGTWGDRVTVHKLYRAPDGGLVRSVREWYQQRSIFTLGGPVGSPKVVNVEYHFALIQHR